MQDARTRQKRRSFDPAFAKLAACINSTNTKALDDAEAIEKDFARLDQESKELQIYDKAKPVLSRCQRVCQDLDMLSSMNRYGETSPNDGLRTGINERLAQFRSEGVSFEKLNAFVTPERVKRELTTKPTPEAIKVGAKLYDGDSGRLLGVIIKPNEQFGKDAFVTVADDPARPEGPSHSYDRYLVELGVDYRVEGPWLMLSLPY